MVNGNEHWNNQEWFRHLDNKLDRLSDKLDSKVNQTDYDKLEKRIEKTEDRSQNRVEQAGIAGIISVVSIWIKNHFFPN